jgi:hypothetical protein
MTDLHLAKVRGVKQPAYTQTTAPSPVGHAQVFTAVRIARAFPQKAPRPEQLQEMLGMSRATSYRWVRAFKAAMGDSADA